MSINLTLKFLVSSQFLLYEKKDFRARLDFKEVSEIILIISNSYIYIFILYTNVNITVLPIFNKELCFRIK